MVKIVFKNYLLSLIWRAINYWVIIITIIDVVTMWIIKKINDKIMKSESLIVSIVTVYVLITIIGNIVGVASSFMYSYIYRKVVRNVKLDYYKRIYESTTYTFNKLFDDDVAMAKVDRIYDKIANFIMCNIYNYNSIVELAFMIYAAYGSEFKSASLIIIGSLAIYSLIAYYNAKKCEEYIKDYKKEGKANHEKIEKKNSNDRMNLKWILGNRLVPVKKLSERMADGAESIAVRYQWQWTIRSANRCATEIVGHLLSLMIAYLYKDKTLFMNFKKTIDSIDPILRIRNEYLKLYDDFNEVEDELKKLENPPRGIKFIEHSTNKKFIINSLKFKIDYDAPITLKYNLNKSLSPLIFKSGEVIKVVGKNGHGKSTFYSYLAKIMRNDNSLREEDCNTAFNERITYTVFQGMDLNITGCKEFKDVLDDGAQGVDEINEISSIFDVPKDLTIKLNEGHKKRLILAKALYEIIFITKPSIIILDEISDGIDDSFGKMFNHMIDFIHKHSAKSVIFITDHHFDCHCDQKIKIINGEIIKVN